MSVNFEVTDTKRAVLSVHKDCGNGSMIVFTSDGRGNIINDKRCIEHVQQVMGTTPGLDTVYDRGACVLDVDVNGVQQLESDSGIAFPVIRKEYWERVLSQAQHEHERKRATHQDVNQNLTSPRKKSVNPTKPHIVLHECEMDARSLCRQA